MSTFRKKPVLWEPPSPWNHLCTPWIFQLFSFTELNYTIQRKLLNCIKEYPALLRSCTRPIPHVFPIVVLIYCNDTTHCIITVFMQLLLLTKFWRGIYVYFVFLQNN